MPKSIEYKVFFSVNEARDKLTLMFRTKQPIRYRFHLVLPLSPLLGLYQGDMVTLVCLYTYSITAGMIGQSTYANTWHNDAYHMNSLHRHAFLLGFTSLYFLHPNIMVLGGVGSRSRCEFYRWMASGIFFVHVIMALGKIQEYQCRRAPYKNIRGK